jgi:hypothetical protein
VLFPWPAGLLPVRRGQAGPRVQERSPELLSRFPWGEARAF